MGYNCGIVDGIFGNKTHIATQSFQRKYKLTIDGLVGKATINRINDILPGDKAIPDPQQRPAISKDKSKYYKKGDAHIIETSPDNVEIKILGNNLNSARVFGVNGTFFDTPKPQLSSSCWAIATNNGKAIGGNSMFNSYNHAIKRGTIVCYRDETIGQVKVNSINEYPKPHVWSIGGYTVLPYMDFAGEKMPGGINYKTSHTYIGYKEKTVYLIVKPNHMVRDIIPLLKELKLDGCILLDGGGSSQLRHPKGKFNQSRRINSAVLLKNS